MLLRISSVWKTRASAGLAVARPLSSDPLPMRPSVRLTSQDSRTSLRRLNLPPEICSSVRIQTGGGAPVRALRVNEVPCGDTKTRSLSDFYPARHVGVGNPRIKSEPVLVGAIAWTVCRKLRFTTLPRFSEPKLLCPASDDRSDYRDDAELMGHLKGALRLCTHLRVEPSQSEHQEGCSW